jgi:pyruvate formate lyase activating enzyme
MIIGGYMQMSLSDYPDHVAAVVFTQGCNFRCPFCHNGSLLGMEADPATAVPESFVMDHLEQRKHILQGVVLSGGEPTLQPDLPDFVRKIRALGLKVKLDTNGSHPDVLADLLSAGLLDYIAMDLKGPLDQYERLAGVPVRMDDILRSIEIIGSSDVEHLFRTTLVPEWLDAASLADVRQLLPDGSFHIEQEFRREDALDSLLRSGVEVQPFEHRVKAVR